MFFVLTALEEFKNVTLTLDLFFFLAKLGQGNHAIIVKPSFSKSFVLKIFSVHTKTQSRFFKFRPFEERFRDGLVWTIGLTVETKLRFETPPA